MTYLILTVLAFIGGLVQSIAGFGSGVVMMMGYPYMFGLLEGAGISSAVSMMLNYSLVWRYRKVIQWKTIIFPLAIYLPVSTVLLSFAKSLPDNILKIGFGVFLIFLSIYNLFVASKRKEEKHLSLPVKVIYMMLSGLCGGLFGIGGPFAVLYFMDKIKEPKVYIGTVQAFFMFTGLYNLIMRIINHIIGVQDIKFILIAALFIILGGIVGSKVVDKINPKTLKKITYAMVGVAGITNLF